MNIVVVGLGYVGMANAAFLSKRCSVVAVDTNVDRVNEVNNGEGFAKPFLDTASYIGGDLDLFATTSLREALGSDPDYVIVCTPTDYNSETDTLDTSSVDSVITESLGFMETWNLDTTFIIKSTVPVGFTETLKDDLDYPWITFVPEFLREDSAMQDCMTPDRVIVGDDGPHMQAYVNLVTEYLDIDDNLVYMSNTEAESVKLFSNAYLAMRVAFFNEMDTFSAKRGMNTDSLIKGVCSDPRIRNQYNNPSFGYGGYCLPKDTKQLASMLDSSPLIKNIDNSNECRKKFIINQILINLNPKTVGVYSVAMKAGSDNSRGAAILDIIKAFVRVGINVIVYEPTGRQAECIEGVSMQSDLAKFKKDSEVILTNRMAIDLDDVADKVYTRDIFGCN